MRSTTPRRFVRVVLAGSLALAACGSDTPDRGDVLLDLADASIIPAYDTLDDQAAGLLDATQTLCDAPSDATVDAARDAMTATRDAWLSSEALWVGPVMERRSWAVVDWPIAADEIEALIADESIVLDNDRLSRRIGADQRGLQAVEYLLWPVEVSPVDALSSTRRCEYLVGITQVIHDETALLPADWSESWDDGAPYRERFGDVANGDLDSLVNDSLFLLEAITDAELGVAMGLMSDEADPTAIIEGPAGLGVVDIESRTAGLRASLIGDGAGEGIAPLLSGDLVDRLRDAFDRADAGLAELSGPLRDRLVDDVATLTIVRDALTEVQVLVSTEVVSALGVTIGFSDADGDSG